MERESLENTEVANLLNQDFISVKGDIVLRLVLTLVDREERPDIDQIYMTFVQASTGHGGWPLNVFLTPDLEPIFGGTYFAGPQNSGVGRPGFIQILHKISTIWKKDGARVKPSGKDVLEQLRHILPSSVISPKIRQLAILLGTISILQVLAAP